MTFFWGFIAWQPYFLMTFFRDFFYKLLLNKGGEGIWASYTLALKPTFSAKKTKKSQFFFLKSINDTRYSGFDTQDFSILWKPSRSRLSIISTINVLRHGSFTNLDQISISESRLSIPHICHFFHRQNFWRIIFTPKNK